MKRYIYILLIPIVFFHCQREGEKRRIRLSDQTTATRTDDQLTTTIHLEPALRRAVAVMFFENQTGDQDLEWLQQGLTEMFIRTLSQSRNLTVLSTDRLYEILQRLGQTASAAPIDLDMAAVVAQEANVEALVSGNITRRGDSLRINVKVHEPDQGRILKEESVEGFGLENIFGMVDQLTQRIKNDLQLSTATGESSQSIADLTTSSLEAWQHYSSGVDAYNKLLFTDAVPELEQAVALDSTFVMAYLRLLDAYASVGNRDLTIQTYNKLQALRNYATGQEIHRMDYIDANTRGDIQSMLDKLQKWAQEYPEDREAAYDLGVLYYNLHNYNESIQALEKALTIDPKYKIAVNLLGYAYANAGDYSNAIATLTKYKELVNDEPNPYDSIGEIYLYMGEYKQAEENFKQALKINDDFIAALNHLAIVYLDRGDYKKALKTYQKYLEQVSDGILKADAYTNIAQMYWRMGKKDEAIASYQKSLDHNVFQIWPAERVHDLYMEKGDTVKARRSLADQYNRIRNNFSSDVLRDTFSTLLRHYAIFHDVDVNETIDVLQETLKDSDNLVLKSRIYLILTLLYYKAGRQDEMEKSWKELLDSDIVKTYSHSYNLTYSGLWRFFSILNHAFYPNIDKGIRDYNTLIERATDSQARLFETGMRIHLADLYFQKGDRQSGENQLKILGMPEENQWMVIGPFDNKNGFQKNFPPEKEIDLTRTYRHKSQKIDWRHAGDSMRDGFVDLQDIFNHSNWSVAYGLIHVVSPDERNVQFRIGSNESVKVWLNDEEIWRFNQFPRLAILDDNTINTTLKPGLNKILIKVCNRVGIWGFYFRLTDTDGKGMEDIRFVSADAVEK